MNITKDDVIRIFNDYFNSKTQSKMSIHEEKEKENKKKTLEMLKNYKTIKSKIIDLKESLNNIQLKRVSGIIKVGQKENKPFKSEFDRKLEKEDRILEKISEYEEIIFSVERALEMIKEEPYSNIIQMKYFDKMTIEDMADKLGLYDNEVKRYHRKYLEDIVFYIFPNDDLLDDLIGI